MGLQPTVEPSRLLLVQQNQRADLTMEGAANFASDEIFEVATVGLNDGAEDSAADGSADFAIEGCSDYYRHHTDLLAVSLSKSLSQTSCFNIVGGYRIF